MKSKFDIKSVALGVLLGAVAVFSIAAATKTPTTVWEYKILYQATTPNGNLIGVVNTAATEGWEVVGYTADNGLSVMLKKAKN